MTPTALDRITRVTTRTERAQCHNGIFYPLGFLQELDQNRGRKQVVVTPVATREPLHLTDRGKDWLMATIGLTAYTIGALVLTTAGVTL